MKLDEILERARSKHEESERLRGDSRFVKTIGKLIHIRALTHTRIPPYRGIVMLEDALWAGELEPRILEVLPAVLLRRPKTFARLKPLPEDLREVLRAIQAKKPVPVFRGIPPGKYLGWIDWIGRKNTSPTLLVTFRFRADDVELLGDLKRKTGLSGIAVLRKALRKLAA